MKHMKELRRKAGLTQYELARELCTAQSAVAMWETGKRTPRADKLLQLARALGCKIEDLF